MHPTEHEMFFRNSGLEDCYCSINPENRSHIIEEIAHVYICLESVRRLMDITDDDIQFFIDAKEKEV